MQNFCDCIIPFYNEAFRIVEVLKEVTQVKNISQIICVDDGSTDASLSQIKMRYPQIKIVRLPKNMGKTKAISTGLQYSKNELILLMDADLRNVNHREIATAIAYMKDKPIDMVILRRTLAPLFLKLNRSDILISGERILRKKDLADILLLKPKKFQLEIAINKYMMNMKKKVYWMPSSATNTFKINKFSFLEAVNRELKAYDDIISYAGVGEYIEQISFFCHQKAVKI